MTNYRPFISSTNVDAVYINGKYQDETQRLNLKLEDIQDHQFAVDIATVDGTNIRIEFHNRQELLDFSNAYNLE